MHKLAAVLLPVALTAITSSGNAQQVVWTQSPLNGHWYTLVLGTGTWCDQESIAQSYGGHLATVRDAQEQAWIVQTFGQGPGPLDIAIGANDVAVQGIYVWASGEPFTLWPNNPNAPWNPWVAGEPNHLSSIEFHAYMNGVNGFNWIDNCGCCAPSGTCWGLVELASSDCNQNGIPDNYELAVGLMLDCNANGIPD